MREQQLGDAVGFFQVRVAGKNEGVDTQVSVFADALGHRWPVTYQRRTSTAPYQADPGPEIGADFQVVLTAAVQSGHALLADRIETGERGLRPGDCLVIQMGDESICGLPGF